MVYKLFNGQILLLKLLLLMCTFFIILLNSLGIFLKKNVNLPSERHSVYALSQNAHYLNIRKIFKDFEKLSKLANPIPTS